MIMRIDGFHSGHHSTCPRECSIGAYRKYDFKFFGQTNARLNTQIAEEANSRLQLIKKTCNWMTQSRMMIFARFFITRTNHFIRRNRALV